MDGALWKPSEQHKWASFSKMLFRFNVPKFFAERQELPKVQVENGLNICASSYLDSPSELTTVSTLVESPPNPSGQSSLKPTGKKNGVSRPSRSSTVTGD